MATSTYPISSLTGFGSLVYGCIASGVFLTVIGSGVWVLLIIKRESGEEAALR